MEISVSNNADNLCFTYFNNSSSKFANIIDVAALNLVND